MRLQSIFSFVCTLVLLLCAQLFSMIPTQYTKIMFTGTTVDLADFEKFVIRAKASGATHIDITGLPMPFSFWQFDTPGDPYPAWPCMVFSLFKVATPEILKPYVPQDYAIKVLTLLEDRCKILRKHELKAYVSAGEPHMLPEAVFTDHPLWRGPRVDQPTRSRVARFAPTIDNPEVLALYRESVGILLRRCPEIDILTLLTNDSGGGLDWSGGLYSGRFGNTLYQHRKMDERLHDFFATIQAGAKDAGAWIEIDMFLTREPDPAKVARSLTHGMAIENIEGPNATPFRTSAGKLWMYGSDFYPVVGIPYAASFLEELEHAAQSQAPRMYVGMLDHFNRELYFNIFDKFWEKPTHDEISRLEFLKRIATNEAGVENASSLLSLWLAIDRAEKLLQIFDSGGSLFSLGTVHQRWITRPLVPFPSELTPEEKDYYRKFQFQARSEAHADNLIDLQGNRRLTSVSGRHNLSFEILRRVRNQVTQAQQLLAEILKTPLDRNKAAYQTFAARLRAVQCLITNAENMIDYQSQLDRIHRLGSKPEETPPIDTPSSWDRQKMLETARREIDNTAVMMDILRSTREPVLDLAPVKMEEHIIRLGPDILDQLQKKLNIMNSHWMDYDRIFTRPNL
ncbi:MAG: hypothetical protein ACOY90_18290 [Candidatus Zhuqueibacterota bacterium]